MITVDNKMIKATAVYKLASDNDYKIDHFNTKSAFVKESLHFIHDLALKVKADEEPPSFMFFHNGSDHVLSRRLKDSSWLVVYYNEVINPFKINSILSLYV